MCTLTPTASFQCVTVVVCLVLGACSDSTSPQTPAVELDAAVPDAAPAPILDAGPPDAAVSLACADRTQADPWIVRLPPDEPLLAQRFEGQSLGVQGEHLYVLYDRDTPRPGVDRRIVRFAKVGGEMQILAEADTRVLNLDAEHVYWKEDVANWKYPLHRVPLDGGEVELVTDLSTGTVFFDGDFVYGSKGVRLSKETGELLEEIPPFGLMFRYGDTLYGYRKNRIIRFSEYAREQTVIAFAEGARRIAAVPSGIVWLDSFPAGFNYAMRMVPHTGAAPIEFPEGPYLNMFFHVGESKVHALTGYCNGTCSQSALWEVDASTASLIELGTFPQHHNLMIVEDDQFYFLKHGILEFDAPGGVRSYRVGDDAPTVLVDGQRFPGGGFAADDEFLYWTNSGDWPEYANGEVLKIQKSGGDPISLAADVTYPQGLTRVGDTLYFTSAGDGTVRSLSTDGGETTVVAMTTIPLDIVSDGANLFWTDYDEGRVYRYALPDGPLEVLADGHRVPRRPVPRGDFLYWYSDNGGGAIHRVPKVGGPTELVVDRAAWVTGLGVDDEFVYYGHSTQDRIFAAPIDGSAVATVVDADLDDPESLVADGDMLYYVEGATIKRRTVDAAASQTVVELEHKPQTLRIDDDGLYWASSYAIGCLPRSQL